MSSLNDTDFSNDTDLSEKRDENVISKFWLFIIKVSFFYGNYMKCDQYCLVLAINANLCYTEH